MYRKLVLIATSLVTLPAAASAQSADNAGDLSRPAIVTDIEKCRTIADSVARLACFDAAAAKLSGAIESKELVVVEQKEVKKAKRSLFGFRLPDLSVFGDKAGEEDQQLKSTVTAASVGKNGRWNITITEGAVWQTTEPVPFRPRVGDDIEIKSGALGSFFVKLRGGRAVRAIRVQ